MISLWRSRQARSVLFQVLAMAGLVGLVTFFGIQVVANLKVMGLSFSFAFLDFPAGYDINQTLITYDSTNTHLRALFVGLLNTALVAFFGIIVATVVGFLIGVMRLSKNFLISRIAVVYIELIRNIPVLLHILLIYGLVVNVLPHPKQALDIGFDSFLTNRGLFMPKPIFEDGASLMFYGLLLGLGLAWGFTYYAKRVQAETGKIYPVFAICTSVILLLPVLGYFLAGQPITMEISVFKTFNFHGGIVVRPEFLALWLALSMYTAAFIAEIVRGGILAVSYGQTEAAHALGIRPNRTLQLVVIPQALRVIIPPLTSQYLNLTKNSSLAIAIGYMDLVSTIGGITLNQTGRAMECMLILLSIYLMFSLLISLFMNWYNNHIKLIER
ncbi:MAG: ABC transporter permease subunit [Alphaproteobacteria bacterium]|nr:ABC transporter permease subunit [Alphaproteobacteria bacterium]